MGQLGFPKKLPTHWTFAILLSGQCQVCFLSVTQNKRLNSSHPTQWFISCISILHLTYSSILLTLFTALVILLISFRISALKTDNKYNLISYSLSSFFHPWKRSCNFAGFLLMWKFKEMSRLTQLPSGQLLQKKQFNHTSNRTSTTPPLSTNYYAM